MRRLAAPLLVIFATAACATTPDPSGPDDEDPPLEGGSGGGVKGVPDAHPARPDGLGPPLTPPPDGGAPPIQLDAGSGPPKGKRIFVTSATFNGDLKTAGGGTSGIDGADKICQGLASDASLGGTWKALISTATQSGIDRMSNVGPYYRLDDEKVFETREQMRTQPLAAIDVTEKFAQLPTDGVWTGTLYGGMTVGPASDTTCMDWESASDSHLAILGDIARNDFAWLDYGGGAICSDNWRLYCVEQ